MTQMIRWLTTLGLILAVGAVTARAEEEEAPPSHRPAPELLPPPLPVDVSLVGVNQLPHGMWSFGVSLPLPCPCPVSCAPAVYTPYDIGYACPVCPCGSPCPCPICPYCSGQPMQEPTEYVVEMKLIHAVGDGDDQVRACPRVSVMENQTATVEMDAVQSPKEQCSHRMQATVMKSVQGVLLDLQVTESSAHNDGVTDLHAHTESTEKRCVVCVGKPMKLELTHDGDGACRSWVEVTVTEAEREAKCAQPVRTGCGCASKVVEEEVEPQCPVLDVVADILQAVFDLDGDTTYAVPPQPPCVECPEYGAYGAELPHCSTSPCTQCVAVEAVKKSEAHVSVDASQDRKCVEISDGARHFKASADKLTMHDGCIELQGDVRAESCCDSCGDCTVIKADKVRVERKDGGLKIDVEGPTTPSAFMPWYYYGN